MPLVPMNAMSTRRVSSTRSACSPTAAWVTPRTRPPSSCSDTVGMVASRAAIGTELVTTTSSRSVGRCVGDARRWWCRRRAARWPPLSGKNSRGRRGDGVLVVGAGGVALADAGFDEVQRPGRDGAAVDAAQHAGPVEGGEVAAHGLGRDVVGLGQLGDRGAALAASPASDRLLALFGVHRAPYADQSYVGYHADSNVDMVGFTPECVDLSTVSCNLVHMSRSSPRHSPHAPAAPGTVLHGVPAVAGVQYAPVIRPGKLPDLDRRRRSARSPTIRAGRPSGTASPRRPPRSPTGCASGRRTPREPPRRCWPRRRRWRRTAAGSAPPRSASTRAAPAVRAVDGAVDQFVDDVHPARRADGRAGHRPARHPRPRHRRTERAARTRRPGARRAVDPVRRGSGARRHRRPGRLARRRARDHARRPDQPHRDHRPPARHPVRRRRRRPRRRGRRHDGDGRRHARHGHRRRPTRPTAARSGRRGAAATPSSPASWTGPGATADGHVVAILANVQDGAAARAGRRDPGRGRRAVPHRAVLPQPRHRADRRRAGGRSTARCSTRSPARRS